MNMKIFVVGATGATGLAFLEQATGAGHAVTAYVRDAAKVTFKHAQLKIIQGELLDIDSQLGGHDAFVSALGHTKLFEPTPYLSQAFTKIIPRLKQRGINRVVYESAYGIEETEADLPFVFRSIWKPLLLRHSYHDHSLIEAQLSQSGLKWTIVRPTGLTHGPLTGQVLAAERLPKGSKSRISRKDVAAYMLASLSDPQTERRLLGLTSKD